MANSSLDRHLLTQLLTAACATAALSLAACDSGTSTVNKQASDASNQAARVTHAAGDPRPTQSFIDSLEDKDQSERQAIATAAVAKIKGDANNQAGAWKAYLEQKSVADDLATASKILSDAVAPDSINPNFKVVVEAQLGATSSQQAQIQLMAAEKKLLDLIGAANSFQLAADYVTGVGGQADVQESFAKSEAPPDNSQLQASIDAAKAAVSKAQDGVSDLQKQITDKQAKAAQIYSDTDGAMAAADALKGNDSIEAGKKIMEQRKEADQLSADVLNLQLQLSQAQISLSYAQVEQTRLESQLAAANAGAQAAQQSAKVAADRAAFLRDEAKKLVEGDDGLTAKYKTFADVASALDGDITKATGLAATAERSYQAATTALSSYQSQVSAKELPADDPLAKAVADPELGNTIKLLGAAAKIESGRVNLLAYSAATLKNSSATAMAVVDKAAGNPASSTTPTDAKALQDKAAELFEAAASAAGSVAGSAKPASPSKWLGFTVQSIALHGLYAATGQAKDRLDAEAAAKSAKDLNPFLNLSGLTSASAQP